jgi:hypothetical protein
VRVVFALAWARLRHRPARWLLVGLGVAAAAMLPVATQAVTAVVSAQVLRYGVEALPPGERSVAAIRSGAALPLDQIADLDATARAGLRSLSSGPVLVQMLSQAISDTHGGIYRFAAVDDLTDRVRIVEGRAPQPCTPARCEVVVLGTGTETPSDRTGLVVVGRAVRTDPLLLAGTFEVADGSVVLLADGVAAAAQDSGLAAYQRAYAWVAPVDLDRVSQLGVDAYLARSAEVSSTLNQSLLSLTAPDQALHEQATRATLSTRRFALLGGAATALLLGFCVIGAIGQRRDHAATAELLRRRGARAAHLVVLAAVAAVVPVLAGAALGTLLGGVVAGVVARLSGLPVMSTSLHAVRLSVPAIGIGAGVAAVVVAGTLLAFAQGAALSGRRAWRGVDLLVAGGAVTAALALARGAVTTGTLDQSVDPLLVALPVIAVVCGGLLVGRVWPPLTAAAARFVPRRLLAPRLALVGAVRNPLRPVATAAFLAAAVAVVTFAGAYQATLRQGAADQAAFIAPLDAAVGTGASLTEPLDAAGMDQYRAAGFTPYPLVRSVATLHINAVQSTSAQLVGVDPAALPGIHGWANLVGAGDPAGAARAIAMPVTSRGLVVPAGSTTIGLSFASTVDDLSQIRDGSVVVTTFLRLPDGRDEPVPMVVGDTLLTGQFPAAPAGTRMFALTVRESEFELTRRVHHEGEGDTSLPALVGTLALRSPVFDGAPSGTDWAGWSADGTSVTATSTLTIAYQLAGDPVVVGPGLSLAEPTLPVLADPQTAALAADGVLSLGLSQGKPVLARVAGVLPRFPDTGPHFVVADARALADRLDAREPGTGAVGELWLAADPGVDAATALARPPFDVLRSSVRQAIEDQLASDPVARGAATLLGAGALLAFVVALLALALLVVAERRDESAELYAWESDGVTPGTLRRSLFLRALAVVAVGVPGGLLIGLALSRITAAVVGVTAVGTAPVPPLAPAVTPLWTVLALAGGVGAGLAACALLAATSLRERLPRPPEEVAV